MAHFLNGSICLSDIPKDKIATSTKNGKKYLNITIWINDTVDQYGNIGSIQVSQTKDERDAKVKKQYIGNFKNAAPPQDSAQSANNVEIKSALEKYDPIEDLPF